MATQALRELFVELKTKVDTKPLEQAEKGVEGLTSKIQKLAAAFGGAVLANRIKDFAVQTIGALDSIAKNASKLQISTDALQELEFAASQSGVSTERLSQSLGILAQRSIEAAEGTGTASEAFKVLGVDVKDADGNLKTVEQTFNDIASGLNNLENPTEKVGTLMRIFGETGKDLLPFFEEGPEGIRKLREEFRQLGGGFDRQLIEKGVEATNELGRLNAVFTGLRASLITELLPAVLKTIDALKPFIQGVSDIIKNSEIFKAVTLALATVAIPLLFKGLVALGTFLLKNPIVLGLTALIAVAEDLFTAFDGGKSIIREFFLSWFDVDIVKLIDQLIDTLPLLKNEFIDVFNTIAGVVTSSLGKVSSAIAKVLQITGNGTLAKSFKSIGDSLIQSGNAQFNSGNRGDSTNRARRAREPQRRREEGARLTARLATQSASNATLQNLTQGETANVLRRITAISEGRARDNTLTRSTAQQIVQNYNVDARGSNDPAAINRAVKSAIQQTMRVANANTEAQ